MPLDQEIHAARKTIVSDGYDMSVGELISLYSSDELQISPAFQRLFRWDPTRKTRFVESLLLGLPIPPIFVYQQKDGTWELIDGLQRVSTILEFVGKLKNQADGNQFAPATVLEGTRLLPSLAGKRWAGDAANSDESGSIGVSQQLTIKRARLRVEILKNESDPKAKYELFQRLNTGGAALTSQEVRNCIAIMLNKSLHDWLIKMASYPPFVKTINQTDAAIEQQIQPELVLRFLAFRTIEYSGKLDVHEYLDDALFQVARDDKLSLDAETLVFEKTFSLLERALSDNAFKRWDGSKFSGKFLMSHYEVIGTGVAQNLAEIEKLENPEQYVEDRAKCLPQEPVFQKYSGAGVRGTSRLTNLLPLAKSYFKP
jgi:hypothetical protein